MASTTRAVSAALHSFLTGAAIGASFAPIPLLPVAIQLIDQIITCCENVKVNREAVKAMQQRCQMLANLMNKVDQSKEEETMRKVIMDLMCVLRRIYNDMELWAGYGTVRSFLLQGQVMGEISQCSVEMERHIKYFEIASHNDIRATVHRIEESIGVFAAEKQSNGIRVHFAGAKAKVFGTSEQSEQGEVDRLRDDMKMMQEQLSKLNVDSNKHKILAQNLYNVQQKSKLLLPDVELKAGEVKRVGTQPIGGSAEFDIWEGLYLEKEKCTLKVIRAASFTERQRSRLLREVRIWRKLWDIDGGEYVVRFYGICFIDGPYPYIVNPLFKNGDALKYIRLNPEVNRLAIIRRVAEGLSLLHRQDPPIAHGELKAAKIMITDEGYPLIADFGLSKMIENATSVPFTQTNVISTQYRWFAPEVCSDTYTVSTASDVFSFAMTILELMTGSEPFANIKRPPEVLMRMQRGERPVRPTDPEVEARGLDDKMWSILERCWAHAPEDRPTIEQVLAELPEVES